MIKFLLIVLVGFVAVYVVCPYIYLKIRCRMGKHEWYWEDKNMPQRCWDCGVKKV